MAAVVYETNYSSPLMLASACPFDNFDTLTRSMRDLTTFADHIARAIADGTSLQSRKRKRSNASGTFSSGHDADPAHISLRPSIHWRETPDGFVLSAATPGLRKDELKVEVLDAEGGSFIEVSGQTAVQPDPQTGKDAKDPAVETANLSKEPVKNAELRAVYCAFSERVRLPADVDRNAMQATYEDGLLVVTMPKKQADQAKRQQITIA